MKSRTMDAGAFTVGASPQKTAANPLVRGPDTADLRFIFAVCTVAFLAVAVLARIFRVRWLGPERTGGTLLGEARSAAGMVVEFVSMN
jgi:hypothetical protein